MPLFDSPPWWWGANTLLARTHLPYVPQGGQWRTSPDAAAAVLPRSRIMAITRVSLITPKLYLTNSRHRINPLTFTHTHTHTHTTLRRKRNMPPNIPGFGCPDMCVERLAQQFWCQRCRWARTFSCGWRHAAQQGALKRLKARLKEDAEILEESRDDAELTTILKVMTLLDDAPPKFKAKLKPQHAEIVTQGQELRAQLPSYLAEQRALVVAHCPLLAVLQPLVAAYAEPTPEDMWTDGLRVHGPRPKRPRAVAVRAVGGDDGSHAKRPR
jgi:hypothetical protein